MGKDILLVETHGIQFLLKHGYELISSQPFTSLALQKVWDVSFVEQEAL